MAVRRRFASPARKLRLLAGVALGLTLLASGALAQPEAGPGPDGLGEEGLYMEADLLTRDDENKVTTASGAVEARYKGRVLRAQQVIYDEKAGVIRAKGEAQIINRDGTAEFADEIVLDDEMKTGVAQGFSARLTENAKIVAATAVRRSENVNELNRAIYSPCPVCAEKPNPTWSIQAERVTQDRDRQVITYRNVTIRVAGAPILYLPVFWHANPQAGRKSGFLTPKIGLSDRRGFSYEQPYYWAISPYQDLIVSPQINAEVNPFLNLRYRKKFYSGDLEVRAGYTYDRDFDGQGTAFGDKTSRSYILASGRFRINEEWRWGFTAERASDDLIFDKYEINDVYQTRGAFVADDRRLISQAYAIRQDQKSYLSIAAFTIQGLRPGSDIDRTFPTAAPRIEGRYEPGWTVAGGRVRLRGSAVSLSRDQSPLSVAPARLPGLDSRRVTGEVDWRSNYTFASGLRVSPFVEARADAYSLDDQLEPGQTSQNIARGLAVAGVDLRWPFYKAFGSTVLVLEPVVQLAASPDAKDIVVGHDVAGQPIYLDEDSVAFEFDETNLFRANKFPGFDLYEDGVRVNVGGRAHVDWADGRTANLLIGRSYRNEREPIFPARTGLQERNSDWIVAADAQPLPGISFFTRARLDADTLDVRRAEAGANVYLKRGFGYFRYLRDNLDINDVKRENVDLGGEVALLKNWGVSFYGNRDLVQDAWIIRDFGVFYKDDCTRLDVIYRREDTVIGRLGPADSVMFRLTLATLGGPIYSR